MKQPPEQEAALAYSKHLQEVLDTSKDSVLKKLGVGLMAYAYIRLNDLDAFQHWFKQASRLSTTVSAENRAAIDLLLAAATTLHPEEDSTHWRTRYQNTRWEDQPLWKSELEVCEGLLKVGSMKHPTALFEPERFRSYIWRSVNTDRAEEGRQWEVQLRNDFAAGGVEEVLSQFHARNQGKSRFLFGWWFNRVVDLLCCPGQGAEILTRLEDALSSTFKDGPSPQRVVCHLALARGAFQLGESSWGQDRLENQIEQCRLHPLVGLDHFDVIAVILETCEHAPHAQRYALLEKVLGIMFMGKEDKKSRPHFRLYRCVKLRLLLHGFEVAMSTRDVNQDFRPTHAKNRAAATLGEQPMFTFRDAHGRNIPHVQPTEMEDLLREGDWEYWRGRYGFSQIDWELGGDVRTLMIVAVTDDRFQISFKMAADAWIHASEDPDAVGSTVVDISDGDFKILWAETVPATSASAIVVEFLSHGLPSPRWVWLREGKPIDVEALDRAPLSLPRQN